MPGVAIQGSTAQPVQLPAQSRFWATVYPTSPGREAGNVGLKITFRQWLTTIGSCVGPMQRGLYKQFGAVDDVITVEADLGSYLFRVEAGVQIIASEGQWVASGFSGGEDPSPYPQRFWRTFVRPEGAWMPPPWYHLLHIVGVAGGGSVSYRGSTLAVGSIDSLPPGNLTVAVGAVIQVGFDL